MGSPKRRGRVNSSDPETLAGLLPEHLRSLKNCTTTAAVTSHVTAVKDWLRSIGKDEQLAHDVMAVLGWTVADWYRLRLTGK